MSKKLLTGICFFLVVCIGCRDVTKEKEGAVLTDRQQQESRAPGRVKMDLKGKKIAMIIASKEFRDEEYLKPKEILSQAGAEITTVSSSLSTSVGMFGAKAKPEMLLSDLKVDDFDAIIFVGGVGSSEYWDDPTAHKIAQDAASANKILAAICIAPQTLANAGILKGKKVAAFPSIKSQLTQKQAVYSLKAVEVDGNIITGSGPEAAREFGEAIKTALLKVSK
ncbi:MAG: DJ-1/PfpI family protein [Elusimicrobiota bacterium]|nr:DJ-1/PfpI family protein [Elusimicrobiota bacterium]